jgi:hypothetical protein
MAKQTRPIKQPIRFPAPKQPVSLPERKAARADAMQRNIDSLALRYYRAGPGKGNMAEARQQAERSIKALQMFDALSSEEQDCFIWMTLNATDKDSPHYAAINSLTTQFANATEPAREKLTTALWALYDEAQAAGRATRTEGSLT